MNESQIASFPAEICPIAKQLVANIRSGNPANALIFISKFFWIPRRKPPRKRGAVFRGFWPVRLIAAARCRTYSDLPKRREDKLQIYEPSGLTNL